jgi:hypothetical protein
MRARFCAMLLLAALGLVFFGELVRHPAETLYSDYSDLITLHLPSKRFLVRAWHETGELPLWCPYNFAGLPFLHDIQVSAFYPPHWPLLLLSEEQQGAALSWLVILHVIVAGWCMFAYARSRGLSNFGALVAGLGYMFAGKWLLHILAGGHYNMVPLAWLPIVLMWLEQAVQRRSIARAAWAGAAYALIILGAYPYVTLYAGLFVAVWTLGTALEEAGYLGGTGPRSRLRAGAALACWAGLGALTALVGLGAGAVQLLPGLDFSAGASRSAGVAVSSGMLMDGMRSLAGLVGPSLSDEPNSWENRAGLGVLWICLAIAGSQAGGRRGRFEGWICLGILGFVLGGAAALQWLPGFRLFRLPSRMFLIGALPVALLAGRGAEAVAEGLDIVFSARVRQVVIKVTAMVALLAGLFALTLKTQRSDMQVRLHLYWATLLITVPAALWLLRRHARKWAQPAWLAILAIDTCALTWPLVQVREDAAIFAPSSCVRYVAERADSHGRVLDFNPCSYETSANHTPLWPGLAAVVGIEPVRGFNPIDILRYKQFLAFLTDDDRPLRPLDQMWTGPILGTFAIKNQNLADLLGIRYLLQPADLALEATVPSAGSAERWTRVAFDASPTTFNFISVAASGRDCGVQPLPPYIVYENKEVLPRAFVVPEAAPLPEHNDLFATLKATDFRRRVLLEDLREPRQTGGHYRPASIREYLPNRVTIDAEGPGYLVLTDMWFPGWQCHLDGAPVPVRRGDYVFRAVELPAGTHHVAFTFAPHSYVLGQWLSLATMVALAVLTVLTVLPDIRVHLPKHQPEEEHYAVLR